MTALGRQVTAAMGPRTPVETAIEAVGIHTVDAEVIPALEAWTQTDDFARCLAALASGQQDFQGRGTCRQLHRGQRLRCEAPRPDKSPPGNASCFSALRLRRPSWVPTRVLRSTRSATNGDDRPVNRRRRPRRQDICDLRSLLAGQAKPSIGGWWQRFDAYELDEGWLRPRANARMTGYDPWDQRARTALRSTRDSVLSRAA